jgi:hypothetical protein
LTDDGLSATERALAERVTRRARLFLALSAAGVAVALALAGHVVYRKLREPEHAIGLHAVVIVLVLLNARLNLRLYRLARILARTVRR